MVIVLLAMITVEVAAAAIYYQLRLLYYVNTVSGITPNGATNGAIGIWLGITKTNREWKYRQSQQLVTYVNWSQGNPSGDGACVEINFSSAFKWNDLRCGSNNHKRFSICEKTLPQ